MTIYNLADLWDRFESFPEVFLLYDSKKNKTLKASTIDSINEIIEEYYDYKVSEFSVSKCCTGFELYVNVE